MIEVQVLVEIEFVDGPAFGRIRRVASSEVAGVPPKGLITAVDNWSAGTVTRAAYTRQDAPPATDRWHYRHTPGV